MEDDEAGASNADQVINNKNFVCRPFFSNLWQCFLLSTTQYKLYELEDNTKRMMMSCVFITDSDDNFYCFFFSFAHLYYSSFFFFASTVRSNGQEAGRVGIHERGTHRWKSQIVCLLWSDASLWFCLYNFILVIACMWWLYKAWLIHSNQVIQMRKPQHNRMNE